MRKISTLFGLLTLAFVLAPPGWASTISRVSDNSLGLSGASGFTPFTPQNTPSVHVVEPGDTLWDLYGPDWRSLLELEENSFLKQPGRIFERGGLTIALIYPGEQILSPFPPIAVSYGAGGMNTFNVNLKEVRQHLYLSGPPAPEIVWLYLLLIAWAMFWFMFTASRLLFQRWKEGAYAVRWPGQR